MPVQDLYNLANVGAAYPAPIPGDAIVNSVSVHVVGAVTIVSGETYFRTVLQTYGSTYYGASYYPPDTDYHDVSTDYPTNPVTASPWTIAELNALRAGCSLQGHSDLAHPTYCTAVRVAVDYTELKPVSLLAHRKVGNPGSGYAGFAHYAIWDGQLSTGSVDFDSSGMGFSATAVPFVSRAVAGGVLGELSADRNPTTGIITALSANAGDTSTVYVILFDGAGS